MRCFGLSIALFICASCGHDSGKATGNGGNGDGGSAHDMSFPKLRCDKLPGTSCGQSCTSDADCGSTLHCGGDKKCEANCVVGDDSCGTFFFCGGHGYCVEIGDDAGTCPSVNVDLTPVIPTVLLLIDQSGSMTMTDFKQGNMNISRWDALRSALSGTGGVLPTLDQKVRFGADLYTGVTTPAPMCPKLTKLAPALGNAGAIQTLMNNNPPLDNTPTGESINQVVADLKASPAPVDPGGRAGPTVIALATDGDPDTCAAPDSNGTDPPKQVSIKAAQDAFTAGFPLYILGISNQINAQHLQDMANAGTGLPIGGTQNAPYYTASSPADLVTAFTTIIRGARSCTFTLNGQVDLTSAGTGDVELNGMPLVYMDANGWSLSDASTMVLAGTACDTFKSQDTVSLTATFPCGTVIK